MIVKRTIGRQEHFSYNLLEMIKDAPLAFRIPADLKRKLLRLAKREARSLSQVCEMLLLIGVEEYNKGGTNYLRRTLPQTDDDNE